MDDPGQQQTRLDRVNRDLSQARSTIPRDVEQIERLKREVALLEAAALSVESPPAQTEQPTDWPMWHEGSVETAPVKHPRLAVLGLVVALALIGAALVVLFAHVADHVSRGLP